MRRVFLVECWKLALSERKKVEGARRTHIYSPFWVHYVFVKASRYIVVYSFFQAASLEEHLYKDTKRCMRRVWDFA
jgi:hypothetical protein